MRALSLTFLSTSFFTALIAALSIVILFVPFSDRKVELDVTPATSTSDSFGPYTYPSYPSYADSGYSQTPYSTVTTTEYLADETSTYLTTATHTFLQYKRSLPSQTFDARAQDTRPTQLPRSAQLAGRQSDVSSSTAAPAPSQTQMSVPQSRVGGVLAIVLLIICAIILIESLALGIYFAVKSKKASKQRAVDVNEGVAAPLAVSTPGEGQIERERTSDEVRVVVSFARCHFSCLLILGILLLIPLALLLYTASIYSNSVGDILNILFINRIGYSSSPFSGSGYGSSDTDSICYRDGYQCTLSDPNTFSNFGYWAGPIVAVLVLGWILFALTIGLAILVCMHRGARRRKPRGSRNSSAQVRGEGSSNGISGLEMAEAAGSGAAPYSDSQSQAQPPRLNQQAALYAQPQTQHHDQLATSTVAHSYFDQPESSASQQHQQLWEAR